MGTFTGPELANIAAQAIEYHYRGQPFTQDIQNKPLLRKLESARKTFPSGKDNITLPVRGDSSLDTGLVGYSVDDTINYDKIVGVERVTYPWREHSAGWQMTHTELKIDGITVTDSAIGRNMSRHSNRDLTVLSNILTDKLDTFSEGVERSMNNLLWGDGTGDNLALHGLQYFITKTPDLDTDIGGINPSLAANDWWRNRFLEIDLTAAGEILPTMQTEMRQLRRYGGRPDCAYVGSGWLDVMESELRAKGYYTDSNWNSASATQIKVADPRWGNLVFEYDPTMDDLGLTDECFIFDSRHIYIYAMDMEYGRDHYPARPHDVYALFRSRTYTCQLVAQQRNSAGRYALKRTP